MLDASGNRFGYRNSILGRVVPAIDPMKKAAQHKKDRIPEWIVKLVLDAAVSV